MFSKFSIYLLLFFCSVYSFSQQNLYSSFTVPEELKKNANAVVRLNDADITLESSSSMIVRQKRIITVLNKKGNDAINAYVYYDNGVKVKSLEAIVYNAVGSEIKKIKEKDFKDVSAVDGGTLYSDSRVKYLEYTPINYPYTIEFSYTISNNSTAFIRPFMPVRDYFVSVQQSNYVLNNPKGLPLRTKEKNFEGFNLGKEEDLNKIAYEVSNIKAFKPESYSPNFSAMMPCVLVASTDFSLEGVQSHVENWEEFGSWLYHDLIKNTYDLPASTVHKIKEMVKNEPNDIAKARVIYNYVQEKTRYISVQVGIGGWKPFNASQVDKLGYGDCKALTNYTMSLLKAAGIKSNYTVVYAGNNQRDIEKDFAAMQGNHAILNIPSEEGDIWLECTSQKVPFGFIGDFTDDRDVLVVGPEGGVIKHTKKYGIDESLQHIKGSYEVSNKGDIEAQLQMTSKGIQYDNRYTLESETQRDLDKQYKERWGYVNNMEIHEMRIENNKKDIEFIEDVSFSATSYSKIVGDRMLLNVNALNRNSHIPDRYRSRKFPLKIKRGFKDIDEIEIKLPSEYKVESLPEDQLIENKFGSYKTNITVKDEYTLVYTREFRVVDGQFPKEDYSDFRDFYKQVAKQDNAKLALIKK